MDNKNPSKIESGYDERFAALEEENKTLKMEHTNLKMEIESLKKVNMLEEKSVHIQKLAIFKHFMMPCI